MPPQGNEWKKTGQAGETWDPLVNNVLQGIYAGRKSNVGPNGSNLYQIKVGDSVISVWGSALIDARFEEISLNEEVFIEFLGMAKNKDGTREYKNFDIQHRPAPFVRTTDGKDIPF